MPELIMPLETDRYFHIYNRANGSDKLFNKEEEYEWFIRKLKKYIVPICEILAYCLMPNHFHLVIRVKNDSDIKQLLIQNLENRNIEDLIRKNEYYISDALSKQFSNLFNAYAKYYNIIYKRKGTLFKRAFRRKLIDDTNYLKQVICYTHQNPVEAGLCDKPDQWKYSSYQAVVSAGTTLIPRTEVIELFDDLNNFIFCNSRSADIGLED